MENENKIEDTVNGIKKRRSKVCNCIFFKSTGMPLGGCKHPSARQPCLNYYIDECDRGKSRFVKNTA